MRSFKRLPPWVFGSRERVDQLVCTPRSYVRAWATDGRPLYAPMLAWSDGPADIGVTGDNSPASLTSKQWLLQVCADGSWLLYRLDDGALTVIPWDDPPDDVTDTARHVTLSFDQSARVVLAWEDHDLIRVRRWDPTTNAYIEDVTFAGVDPALVFDAAWTSWVPGSDVLLFYLSTDRERLCCRVQRDVYATEYTLWDFGENSVLDRVVALPFRYEVLISDALGVPRDPLLISGVYPVRTTVPLFGDAMVHDALYELSAADYQHSIILAGDAVAQAGDYALIVTRITHDLPLDGDGAVQSGVYDEIAQQVAHNLKVTGDAAMQTGVYVGPAVEVVHDLNVTGDAWIVGGTYATA